MIKHARFWSWHLWYSSRHIGLFYWYLVLPDRNCSLVSHDDRQQQQALPPFMTHLVSSRLISLSLTKIRTWITTLFLQLQFKLKVIFILCNTFIQLIEKILNYLLPVLKKLTNSVQTGVCVYVCGFESECKRECFPTHTCVYVSIICLLLYMAVHMGILYVCVCVCVHACQWQKEDRERVPC